MTTKWRSKDALNHNLNNVWLVKDCNSKKWYINIQNSLMYSRVKMILSHLIFRQLFFYKTPKYRHLLFMIHTLQKKASRLCDLNSGFHTFNTERPSSYVTCALFRFKFYRKIMVQHQGCAVTLCHLTLFFSHTLNHTSTCHVHK
jgi:hypothetical protein